MDSLMKSRIALVKEMDAIARSLNDEDLIDIWLMNGCPDESTDEDYEYIATNLEEFKDIVKLFSRLMNRYVKDESDFYCGE